MTGMVLGSGLIIIAIASVFFLIGIHSIDNAWNIHYLNKNYGFDFVD